MDFSYSTAELDFREDVRDWINKNIPGDFGTPAWPRPDDPKKFKVEEGGSELINDVAGHGKSFDLYTTETFGDAIITLEVMVPKGANSGIYVMGEYEVQVLDSFGKEENPGPGETMP